MNKELKSENIEDYRVIRASGEIVNVFDNLRSKVMNKVKRGWIPIGGVDIDTSGGYKNNSASQAMVKLDNEDNSKQILND